MQPILGAAAPEIKTICLDQRIASLREKPGFFHDYVQTVPYLGY